MPRWVTEVALLALVSTTIGCDQVSKHLAATHLIGVPRQSFLGDVLRLEYAENTGGFLSLGAGLPSWVRTALFTVGTGILLVACAIAAFRPGWQGTPLFGLALVFAGGSSNLVDRAVRGSVIDFLNVGVGSVRTGIFNVADMAVMLGVGLLLVHGKPEGSLQNGAA
jgi:signal peptidase II